MVAPSLELEYGELYYPMYVIPDNKLTVNDIFEIAGDHYEGTEFDLTKGQGAGPWGDPLTNYRIAGRQRPIGIPLTCYLQIGQVKSWLPDPIKGITWFGYGSVGHSFITPLFPAMGKLPELYENGSRYEEFRRDSGWWINTYVQEVVGLRYEKAIEDLKNFRDPKMQSIYDTVPILQDAAAKLYEINPDAAIDLLGDYAYDTALGWYDDWLKLGDEIFARYACERINFRSTGYPDWWIELLETDIEIINN
jgi:dipeptidase